MSSFYKRTSLVLGLAACLSQPLFAAEEKKEGPKLITGASTEMLANTCAGCHGPDGASTGPATPSIGGISTDYFIEQMEGFKNDEVPSTIMGRIAKGYSSEEFEQMAEYFSAKKFVAAKGQESDADLAEKGAKLHDKYCEKCHADGGTSAEDDSGILGGQWKMYNTFALEDFTSGNRKAPKKMAKKLKKLMEKEGDEGVKALIEFYAK